MLFYTSGRDIDKVVTKRLFKKGGEPVVLIRGANAPLIRKTLLKELQIEKEVLEGTRQRASVGTSYVFFTVILLQDPLI